MFTMQCLWHFGDVLNADSCTGVTKSHEKTIF